MKMLFDEEKFDAVWESNRAELLTELHYGDEDIKWLKVLINASILEAVEKFAVKIRPPISEYISEHMANSYMLNQAAIAMNSDIDRALANLKSQTEGK